MTDDFTTSIATAIQAKTGGNVEGKLPEWWAEFIGMVLDELQSAGRLVPTGGMALTAEQVEDVRLTVWSEGDIADAAYNRLRALFPATEPAEGTGLAPEDVPHKFSNPDYQAAPIVGTTTHKSVEGTCNWCRLPISKHLPHMSWFHTESWNVYCRPTPAEPAEEETKAEVVQDIEVMQWDGTRKSIQAICDWVNSFDDELDDPTISYCFSSAAPDDVLDVSLTTNEGDFVRVSDGDFIVRDTQGNFYRRDRNAYATVAASSPVVPAPAETGPWKTCGHVPIGIVFRSKDRHPAFTWVNEGGSLLSVRNECEDGHFSDGEHCLPSMVDENFAPFVAAEEG